MTERTQYVAAIVAAGTLFLAQQAAAAAVAPGFDLLQTTTAYITYPEGVPSPPLDKAPLKGDATNLSTQIPVIPNNIPPASADAFCGSQQFNFGTGCVATGGADTIVHRPIEALDPVSTIPVEVVGLSLISTGFHDVFVPGSPERLAARMLKDMTTGEWIYGQDAGSTATIDFINNTWTSTLSMDILVYGVTSLESIIVHKDFSLPDLYLPSGAPNPAAATWSHDAPADALLLPGINYLLAGTDTSEDFWTGLAIHDTGGGTIHGVVPHIPAPAALPLLAGALAALAGLTRRARA